MKRIPKLKDKHGFTLVELLMVVAIFGILMIAIQAIFIAGMNVFNWGKTEAEKRRQLYIAVEQIVKKIRNTPTSGIKLISDDNGIYRGLLLESLTGVQTYFYLEGDKLYREENGTRQVVAKGITDLRFSVICNMYSGRFDSYNSKSRKIIDNDGRFNDYDPGIKGMVVRFEHKAGSEIQYIYRKIVDYGQTWFEIDSDFDSGFLPTNQNYAIGNTYQIYIQSRIAGSFSGVEITTGVRPRL
ncbi:hypothetical protein BBF96_14570 [Anoxybacter fermentans]|uniref:Prepilin-type N-terminal cleavage/methylation domain-containing protein n=1 Tax=Anoxybacter fermentans TaxID=1323375 RepID=A0A3Q9HU95_9FIRM|nr:prepilin-type N-terminal cleavage/methylation domain-containing protein [Anoxybacter fermentans]AZR74501.1 hypothetical protein BBF96_14570 [Anoxybacter fermentans]